LYLFEYVVVVVDDDDDDDVWHIIQCLAIKCSYCRTTVIHVM